MNDFVVGLTNTNPAKSAPVYKQYRHVQYSGVVALSATVSLTFESTAETFRYVIIHKQFPGNDAICMKDVKVFVRGRQAYMYAFCVLLNSNHCVD